MGGVRPKSSLGTNCCLERFRAWCTVLPRRVPPTGSQGKIITGILPNGDPYGVAYTDSETALISHEIMPAVQLLTRLIHLLKR